MSKDLVFPNAPAYLAKAQALADKFNTAAGGGISQGFSRISIRGSRFRIVQNGEETTLDSLTLETVLIGANPNLSKIYYEGAYDAADTDQNPDCFSNDGITPDPQSRSKQAANCATCKQNVWGSKISPQGNEIKACADIKRVAVLASADLEGDVFGMTVPAASLKGLGNYIHKLDSKNIPVVAVKTKISFNDEAAFPKLEFSFGGFLDEAEMSVALERAESHEINNIVGITHRPAAGVTSTQTTPATQDDVDDSDDVDEAAEAEKKKAKAAAKRKATLAKKKAAEEAEAAKEKAESGKKSTAASAFGGGAKADKPKADKVPEEAGTDDLSSLEGELEDILGELDFGDD